jgi:hypothetical protein
MKRATATLLFALGLVACSSASQGTGSAAEPTAAAPTAAEPSEHVSPAKPDEAHASAAESAATEEKDGCDPEETANDHAAHAKKSSAPKGREPVKVEATGARVFGQELAAGVATVALKDIVANAAAYNGKVVRTEGEVTQVCKSMGCWLEIRAEGAPQVRVPTAGHSFFLPQDIAGRHAIVEGTVKTEPLSEARKKHLEAEGAQATDNAISISATSVVVR